MTPLEKVLTRLFALAVFIAVGLLPRLWLKPLPPPSRVAPTGPPFDEDFESWEARQEWWRQMHDKGLWLDFDTNKPHTSANPQHVKP